MDNSKKSFHYILVCFFMVFLAALDQILKLLVIKNIKPYHDEVKVLGNYIVLYHIKNSGTAWGLLSNRIPFLIVVTIVVFIFIFILYHNLDFRSRYLPIIICLTFISGGAIGNMIDRIRLHYVTDYIYIKFINFPVFNFADMCITIPVFLLLLFMIFKYNSDDFDVFTGNKILLSDGRYEPKRTLSKKTDKKNNTIKQ